MDIKRSTPHFSLAGRSNKKAASAAVVPNNPVVPTTPPPMPDQQQTIPSAAQETKKAQNSNPATANSTQSFKFEPAPPPQPKLETKLEQADPIVVHAEQEVSVTNEVQQVTAEHATVALQPTDPIKPGKHIPLKYVAVGATALAIALLASVLVQQMAISELKYERRVLGEQLKVVNPIRAGSDSTGQ